MFSRADNCSFTFGASPHPMIVWDLMSRLEAVLWICTLKYALMFLRDVRGDQSSHGSTCCRTQPAQTFPISLAHLTFASPLCLPRLTLSNTSLWKSSPSLLGCRIAFVLGNVKSKVSVCVVFESVAQVSRHWSWSSSWAFCFVVQSSVDPLRGLITAQQCRETSPLTTRLTVKLPFTLHSLRLPFLRLALQRYHS